MTKISWLHTLLLLCCCLVIHRHPSCSKSSKAELVLVAEQGPMPSQSQATNQAWNSLCVFKQAHGITTTMRSGLVGNNNKSKTSAMVVAKDDVVDFLTEIREMEGGPYATQFIRHDTFLSMFRLCSCGTKPQRSENHHFVMTSSWEPQCHHDIIMRTPRITGKPKFSWSGGP